ncbi:MAG: BACON domain-containing protein [Prevotella sp.]|nr:BACON domain-containing protein [Prevotella sp.]
MKKLLYFAFIACLTGLVSACGDDSMENPYATDDVLTVLSNDVMLPSTGGSGTIVVDGNGTVTAESSLSWCSVSVSGNTITVTAPENNAFESRNAVIKIRSGNKSTEVVAYQEGLIFSLEQTTFSLNDDAQTVRTSMKLSNPNLPVRTGDGVDWVKASFDSSTGMLELQVEANNTGLPREGTFDLLCGDYKAVVTITQYEYEKDVLGFYYVWYYASGSWAYDFMSLEEDADGNTQLRLIADWNDIAIPVTMDKESLQMTISNLAPMGVYAGYQVLCFVRGLNGNSIYRSSNAAWAIQGSYLIYDDGTAGWQFDVNSTMTASSYTYYGISLGATTDGTYSGYVGWLQNFYYFELEKMPNDDAGAKGTKIKNLLKKPIHK